jgi:hypothetical protein
LLLSIAIPVVSDLDLSDIFAVDQPLTAEAAVTYRQIEEMPIAGEPVFVVFDYSPAFMGELQLQASALLQHLGQKDAQVVALSLTPEGAALAQQVLDDEDVNLGYLPGEAVAVRSLEFLEGQLRTQAFNGQDLKGTHVLDSEGLLTLSDSALIVLLTGDANNFRWWVEQTTALEKDLARNLPLVAGVSAAIGPMVRPYYEMESPQLDGLLVGLTGAADYELLLGSSQAPARVRLSGTLLGQLVVSGLILIGVVLYSFSRGGGPAEGQSR